MIQETLSIRVIRDDAQAFKSLSGETVLIYWPHGLGDWVFLSYISKFLSPANRYFVTRNGDDNVSLFEGSEDVTPIYTGVNSTRKFFSVEHFGISGRINDEMTITVPSSLKQVIIKERITIIFYWSFYENWGKSFAPFHTKARAAIKDLSVSDNLTNELNLPLKSSISFNGDSFVDKWVSSRLALHTAFNSLKRLCIIGRTGYTSTGKNWGHKWRSELPIDNQVEGAEARDFMKCMLIRDRNWVFLTIEDVPRCYPDSIKDPYVNCFAYADVFGNVSQQGLPFGIVMKSLVKVASLVVGVPAGPYHVAMAYENVPVVGIWTEHLPSWYDEPRSNARHIGSNNLITSGMMAKTGSLREPHPLAHHMIFVDSNAIPGNTVAELAYTLIS